MKSTKVLSSQIYFIIKSFQLLSADELSRNFTEMQSFESMTIGKAELLYHIQHLFDDIEKQTKCDYEFYADVDDRGSLDVKTFIKHLRFDYISINCDTIIILFAAYLDSNTGAIKDLMQYFDYRVYQEKGDT